jgi:hypothetical protein
MRTTFVAIFFMAGIVAFGASRGSAAPADGAALGRTASAVSLVAQTRYVRWHGRTCYAKCYYNFFAGRHVCRRFC